MSLIKWCGMVVLILSGTALAKPDADPVETVKTFTAALQKGDRDTAQRLLAPDVLIYEAGGVESSREEYASHHLGGDIEFMSAAKVSALGNQQLASGDLAVVATRSRIVSKNPKQPLDLFSTETMVLRRGPDGWRIAHIHWSSRSASKAAK